MYDHQRQSEPDRHQQSQKQVASTEMTPPFAVQFIQRFAVNLSIARAFVNL